MILIIPESLNLNIFTDKKMIQKSIAAIQKAKLDQPFPLKYTSFVPANFFFPLKLVAPNYEGNSIWMHLGLCYLDVVAAVDKKLAKKYLALYAQQVEEQQNFLELFSSNGSVYKTFFYHADERMLWAGKLLALKQTL